MRAPGFAAEFSIYASDCSYRVSAGSRQPVARSMIVPQKISCGEYECGGAWGNFPPTYCIRCESDRLQ